MGTIQEFEVEIEVDGLAKGLWSELVATERDVQYGNVTLV